MCDPATDPRPVAHRRRDRTATAALGTWFISGQTWPRHARAPISLTDVLRLLDIRTGSYAEVRLARGVLRVCACLPHAAAGSDITALRLLLVADLLARTAELGGLQVLMALQLTGASPDQAAAIERDADALGIHPPAAYGDCRDALSALGGPIDVHLASQDAGVDPGLAGLFAASAPRSWPEPSLPRCSRSRAVYRSPGRSPRGPPRADVLPRPRPADVTTTDWPAPAGRSGLAAACGPVGGVALPADARPIAETAGVGFQPPRHRVRAGDAGRPAADASVPAGAKFEAFVYADRILGLDLAREIGR